MKRPARTLLIVVGALFALVLLILVLTPMLFGDRIAGRVKTEVNKSLDAKVDWRSAGLGLFHDFPNLTLTLDDLTAVGVGKFEGDTLASVRHLRVVLDLFSAVRSAMGSSSPIVVRARRARPPADLAPGPRGRLRQLGHHQEDGGRRPSPRPSPGVRWRSACAASRSTAGTSPSTTAPRS